MSDQSRDTGFAYPRRWSSITAPAIWPETNTLLDLRQREIEQFLYASPDRFAPVWYRDGSPPVSLVATFTMSMARFERMRGRFIALSWFAQFSAMSSGGTNLLLALPHALWPALPAAGGSNAPAMGSSGRFVVGHTGVNVDVELKDFSNVSPVSAWALNLGFTDTTAAGLLPNGIIAGHVIYGLAT